MTFEVTWSPRARRAIQHELPESAAAACYEFVTGALARNPYRLGHQLRGSLSGMWSARRGEYRVVYEVHDERVVVHVVDVRHRRDVYRRN